MSQALGVSTSGFYEWLTRPESDRSMTNRAILVRIRESFEASHQTYGSPRVWRDLRDWNVPCGENRTARLMRKDGLVARVRLKTARYDAGRRSMIAPNVLDRHFEASEPNQKWVADFTYIPTREGWLYLAVVLDLYSRMVVGWSMQRNMSTELVSDAMTMALWRRRPVALLQHSDQGVSGILCDAGRLMVDWSGSLFVLVDHNTRSAVSSPKGGRSSGSGFSASAWKNRLRIKSQERRSRGGSLPQHPWILPSLASLRLAPSLVHLEAITEQQAELGFGGVPLARSLLPFLSDFAQL